jgi:trehalose/maltose hydrolase-like predicted phosphorylase
MEATTSTAVARHGASKGFTTLSEWVTVALAAPAEPAWQLTESGYRPALEHDIETRFAVGNGLLGVRGSLEQPTIASRPRTFIAGLFDTPAVEPPIPALVPGPDWLRLNVIVAGEPLTLEQDETLAHTRTLDLRRGLLLGDWEQRTMTGQLVRQRTLRLVSLADRALAVQIAQIEVDHTVDLTLEGWLEPPAHDMLPVVDEHQLQVWRTAGSEKYLAVASSMVLWLDEQTIWPIRGDTQRRTWTWHARANKPAIVIRVVAFARGDTVDDTVASVRHALQRARRAGPRGLLAAHERAWAQRWSASDVVIEGDETAQRALRFALYHLISAANPSDSHTSIGARALTGDAYLGHVFWDTEIFLLPFYTATWPEAAQALLRYRWRTLPAARAKAARLGYRGALYAWESADSGEEATPPYVWGPDGQVIVIRCGTEEQHISADVAYAVWQHWLATSDEAFLREAGAEILLETARFWASRATLEDDGRYHLRGVIGPDEYHEGVDDNAYTSGLAQWNIERGLEVADLLRSRWPEHSTRLEQQLALTAEELDSWRAVAERLVTGFDPATCLIEQFAGYFDLEPIDLAAYTPRRAPMDVVLGRQRTQQSQVIKQADVVMLLALLWERYPALVRATNFHYYEPRCGHGSSLSPAMHALVAARLGDVERAVSYVHQAAAIDLDDTMGNAASGVHIATLGGLWQAMVFGFAGLQLTDDGFRCDPRLPAAWRSLQVPVQWQRNQVRMMVHREPHTVRLTLERGRTLVVAVGDLRHTLGIGQTWACRWDAVERCWREVGP